MATLMCRIAFGISALTIAGGAFAQTQVYRYTDADGRVVYTDRQPTGDVKNLQTKKMGSNFVSTSEPSYAAALAAERGVSEWRLSLTHTERTAQAIAIAL